MASRRPTGIEPSDRLAVAVMDDDLLPRRRKAPLHVTQCVGKWHLGENAESQPQNVGFDDFYGFLSVSDMYTEWRDPYFFPEIVYSRARTEWVENQPFHKSFVHAVRDGELEQVEEVTIPVRSERHLSTFAPPYQAKLVIGINV